MDFIEKLNQKHMLIMYHLLFGESQKRIAKMMNLTERHVCRVVNSPVFKDEFKRLSEEMKERIISSSAEVQQIIDSVTPEAARNLIDLMHNASNDRDRLRAIDLIFSYSSLVSEKEKAVEKPSFNLSEEEQKIIMEGLDTIDDKPNEKEISEKEGKEDKYVLPTDFSRFN